MNFFNPKIIDRNKFNDYTQISLTYLAIAVFAIFAIRPSLVKAYGLYRQYKDYKVLSETLKMKVENLNTFEDLKKNDSEVFNLIDNALPRSRSESDLIKTVNLAASDNQVVLKSITFNQGKLEEPTGAKSVQFGLEVDGGYQDIIKFIGELTNTQRVMSVESLDLTLRSNNVLYVARIKVRAYYK